VEAVAEGTLSIRIVRTQERDRREFPRVSSRLDVHYLILPEGAEETVSALWIQKGEAPADAAWHRPGPLVDLSASGLALDVMPNCKSGDQLLVALTLEPGAPPWRGVARVVRVALLMEAELLECDPDSSMTHRMSLELTDMPDEARQAILERTIDLMHMPGESSE